MIVRDSWSVIRKHRLKEGLTTTWLLQNTFPSFGSPLTELCSVCGEFTVSRIQVSEARPPPQTGKKNWDTSLPSFPSSWRNGLWPGLGWSANEHRGGLRSWCVKGEGEPAVPTVVAEEAVAARLSTWHRGLGGRWGRWLVRSWCGNHTPWRAQKRWHFLVRLVLRLGLGCCSRKLSPHPSLHFSQQCWELKASGNFLTWSASVTFCCLRLRILTHCLCSLLL